MKNLKINNFIKNKKYRSIFLFIPVFSVPNLLISHIEVQRFGNGVH